MRAEPSTRKIGEDTVTYFPVISDPRDHALHEIVGRIVIEFGRLELLVKTSVEKLSRELAVQGGLPAEDVNFTEGMAQAEKLHDFKKYCVYLAELFEKWKSDPKIVTVFKLFMTELQEIGEQRNAIIHGCWTVDADGKIIRLRSRRDPKTKALQQSAEVFTLEDLEDFYSLLNHRRFVLAASTGFEIGHVLPIAAPAPSAKPTRGAALISDLLATAIALGIERQDIAATVGLHPDELIEVAAERMTIDENEVVYGRAKVLVNFFRKLLARYEGDAVAARRWMHSMHKHLDTTPALAVSTNEGFFKLLQIHSSELWGE